MKNILELISFFLASELIYSYYIHIISFKGIGFNIYFLASRGSSIQLNCTEKQNYAEEKYHIQTAFFPS